MIGKNVITVNIAARHKNWIRKTKENNDEFSTSRLIRQLLDIYIDRCAKGEDYDENNRNTENLVSSS